jgi:hypothetical protein
MIGIPMDRCEKWEVMYMYYDNITTRDNTISPEFMLRKRSNSIAYHTVCEAMMKSKILQVYIPTVDNVSNFC